ncbi:LytR/AlgR family response regulator transcription factor [Frisingicoccus sp.]|uniref:LytR/AlgR family response regulator transcription factor n=1 Tax=Frisingicoccus sp. TaxID=1918627 RepID=UPI002E75CF4D|nr:LytTR family DNA-binding domain-containing protein [Frisingicoccus sp.]MEE0753309.1 LytTR family DNA-binding domain-containing protein [Frisingicoccus sp.]
MLKIAICEDMVLHQKCLQNEIEKLMTEPCEFFCFSSASLFETEISEKSICFDIVFMDIEFGTTSGIKLGREINNRYPLTQIIYVTGYPQYAGEVYKTDHVWFIEKNQLGKYLPLALNKALRAIQLTKNLHLNISWQKEKFSILQKEIIYIERNLRTSEIYTLHTSYQTSEKLDSLMERLTDAFAFSHRSYIVNMEMITSLTKTQVILNDIHKIPVSRSKCTELKNAYNRFMIQ